MTQSKVVQILLILLWAQVKVNIIELLLPRTKLLKQNRLKSENLFLVTAKSILCLKR